MRTILTRFVLPAFALLAAVLAILVVQNGTTPLPADLSSANEGDEAFVSRVIDGDTIELASGERVRYIGIDTPESVKPESPVECFGKEASERNRELVEGKNVRLIRDVSDTDRYGRLLRYVYVGETFVNGTLVEEGYAYTYTAPPDVLFADALQAGERAARESGRGLWSACPETTADPGPATDTIIACSIKGNINGEGEKIYHLPGCDYYKKTSIDEARGERWFCTEEDAAYAGWRKAGNCP